MKNCGRLDCINIQALSHKIGLKSVGVQCWAAALMFCHFNISLLICGCFTPKPLWSAGCWLVFSLFKREKYLTSKPAWCLYLSEYFSEIEIRMKSCHSFGQKKTVYYKEADILWTNVGNNRLWSNSQTQMRHYQYTSYIGEKEI